MKQGAKDRLIAFIRDGEPFDDGMTTIPGAPTEIGKAWAEVKYGSGWERRQQAQEEGGQAATFIALANALTRGVKITDRIGHDGVEWDITGIAPMGRGEIEFTATRAA